MPLPESRGSGMIPGMVAKPAFLAGWTGEHVRHAATMIWPGTNPAARLETLAGAPVGQREAARLLLWQVGLLWRRGIIDYLLLRAIRP